MIPPQTPTAKPQTTPKSSKKQLTKPGRQVEAMDSSQSEGEEVPKAKQRSARFYIFWIHNLPAALSPCSPIFLILISLFIFQGPQKKSRAGDAAHIVTEERKDRLQGIIRILTLFSSSMNSPN